MATIPHVLIAAAVFAIVLGLPFGLYALLTRGRRRTMREIRMAAAEQGWQFRRRRILRGDPTEFDIRGRTHSGLEWILTSRSTSGYDRGWCVRLGLRVPILAGEADFSVESREPGGDSALRSRNISPETQAKVARFSGTLGGAVGLLRDAREFPSGEPAFDEAYQVMGLRDQIGQPLVDKALAARILHWPANTIRLHAMLAWRDPFGLHLQARLPAMPNWATVSYFLSLAEEFTARVPAARPAAASGLVDRAVARFVEL